MRKEEKKKQANELRIRMDEVKKESKALRNALKIQKDEEQKIKMLQKGSNDSRKGRPRKEASIGMESQQSLPIFLPETAYLDPELLVANGPYFSTHMEGVVGEN